MSCSPYASRLANWARAHAQLPTDRSYRARIHVLSPAVAQTLDPERNPEVDQALDAPQQAMAVELLERLRVELAELATGSTQDPVQTYAEGPGYAYTQQGIAFGAGPMQLVELWRFGVSLDLPDPDTDAVRAAAQARLDKNVRGALKVARRRSQTFARGPHAGLSRPGAQRQTWAHRLEAALSVLLSDAQLWCTRADLATDWLQSVDLWRHRPGQAPHKGRPMQVSMAGAGAVGRKKSEAGHEPWTPADLAARCTRALQTQDPVALGAWEALGRPASAELLAQRIAKGMQDLAQTPRGRHPASQLPAAVVRWWLALRGHPGFARI